MWGDPHRLHARQPGREAIEELEMQGGSRHPSYSVFQATDDQPEDVLPPAGPAELRQPPPRPTFHEEEGRTDRGEWWPLVKAVAIVAGLVAVTGWLISR